VLADLVTRGERPVTLLAHSLAASLWLTHLARGHSPGLVTRLALAAIPSPGVLRSTVVEAFIDHPPVIAPSPGVEQIVFEGENDPYSPGGVRASYAIDPSIPVEAVPQGGHLIPDSGFGPWPRILEWTLAAEEVPS
jgi:predicted alpha/beta hydrolase family esterase